MKIISRSNDNYQLAKDIQHLEDQMTMQNVINKNIEKGFHKAGFGLMLLSAGGYLILSLITGLDKRIKALEKNRKIDDTTDKED